MIKAIIFDFGGVFCNDTDEFLFNDIADKFQVSREQVENVLKDLLEPYQKGEISDEEFWQKFSQKVGKILPQNYESLWIDKYALEKHYNENMFNLLGVLRSKGFTISLLSNTIPPHSKYNKNNNKFDLFDKVILSCDVGMIKPEEGIYRLTLDRLGLNADECVFIDDKVRYAEAAEKIGMKAIVFFSYEKLIEKFKEININI